MLNKKMVELFKNLVGKIDDYAFFDFFELDDFIEYITHDKNYDYDCESQLHILRDEFKCTNNNSIVLLYNSEMDEYLIINFETSTMIITQNDTIKYVDNNTTHDVLYNIMHHLFINNIIK